MSVVDQKIFYSISAAADREVVTLNVGDQVTIDHAVLSEDENAAIVDAYSIRIDSKAEIRFS